MGGARWQVTLLLLTTSSLVAAQDKRRVIHVGNESRKLVRQNSMVEDTIRTVQEPLTGPGHKEQDPVKDKGGGDDEDRKTLAQQVAEGKYGLIQAELFLEKPRRPGIVSYEVNPEVPKDNVNNLGGLQPDEIWLAENHLVVLAGGGFSKKETVWPAIDNYIALPRQVKIPPNPKVPPPFPVQLKPGGPIEFIKNENGTGGFPRFPPPPDSRFPLSSNASFPYPPAAINSGNFTVGNGPHLPPPFPFYPLPPNGQYNPPPGFLPPIPPGAAFLPPPENRTDQFDEDDPSIYYPPPYDFYYQKDNNSLVPPGPLVPGIVLPPPPDFFAPYKNTTISKTRRPSSRLPHKSKIPLRKPTKQKNVQILTSTEESYDGVTSRPNTGNVNILKAPPALYSTLIPPTVTTELYTRRPTVKTSTHDIISQSPPKTIIHALPPNAIVKGWVPIPAPRPYYITGTRKEVTSTTLPPDYNSVAPPVDHGYIYSIPDYQLSFNNWLYRNQTKPYEEDTNYFNVITQSPKQNVYYEDLYLDRGQYYSSTESPLIYKNRAKLKSILYPATSTVSPESLYKSQENRGKSIKTFYFYEEPHISEGKITDTERFAYPTTSPQVRHRERNPHTITEEVYINTMSKKEQPSYRQFKPSPLDYFSQGDFIDVSAPESTTETPSRYQFVPQGPQSTATTKPPVYEFSFSIPGYGSPKVRDYHQTTVKPVQQEFYYTTPVPTTARTPQYFTTQKPQAQYYSAQNTNTENPYHAFFTHHDAELIDDITKKYFTTFGQKLNKDTIRGDALTTPLPPAERPHVKTYYDRTARPPYRPKPNYYSTVAPPAAPIYDTYYDQGHHPSLTATQKPISLGSDILVNYKEPLPVVNPDAEFIDPSTPGFNKPDQSFISYSLPGNGGGHFFFLTPQVVQQSQQFSDYLYNEGPQYKRNARRLQNKRRQQTPSPTT